MHASKNKATNSQAAYWLINCVGDNETFFFWHFFSSHKIFIFYYLLDLEKHFCYTSNWLLNHLRCVCSWNLQASLHMTYISWFHTTSTGSQKSEWMSLVKKKKKKPEREIPLWLTLSWSGLVLWGLVKFTTLSSAYLKSGWIGEQEVGGVRQVVIHTLSWQDGAQEMTLSQFSSLTLFFVLFRHVPPWFTLSSHPIFERREIIIFPATAWVC